MALAEGRRLLAVQFSSGQMLWHMAGIDSINLGSEDVQHCRRDDESVKRDP